jgi:hypothetical protein
MYNKTTDTLTAGSATITGAATVGTTLGLTGQSTLTGHVGVGVTPSAWGGAGTKALQVGATAFGSLFDFLTDFVAVTANLHWTGTNYSRMSASSKFATAYYQEIATGEHQWLSSTAAGTNAVAPTMVPKMTLTAAGNLSLANGNVVMATSGKGIDFSAVTGGTGTATANVLNDYEEGTFTATLKGGTTDPTIAVTTTGKYTKIGNQVFVRIMFGNVSTLGASGSISITGLPFTSATTPEQIGYLMVENMATFTNSSLSSYLPASSTTLSLYTSTSNSIIAAITHNAGVARYLWTAITYTAA